MRSGALRLVAIDKNKTAVEGCAAFWDHDNGVRSQGGDVSLDANKARAIGCEMLPAGPELHSAGCRLASTLTCHFSAGNPHKSPGTETLTNCGGIGVRDRCIVSDIRKVSSECGKGHGISALVGRVSRMYLCIYEQMEECGEHKRDTRERG